MPFVDDHEGYPQTLAGDLDAPAASGDPHALAIVDLDAHPASGHLDSPGASGGKRARRKRAKNIPWDLVEAQYVKGAEVDGHMVFPTLDELAERFHVGRGTVYDKSSLEGWGRKRDEYKRTFVFEAHRRTIGRLLAKMERFDGNSVAAAEAAIREILRAFALHEATSRKADGTLGAPMPPATLESLMRSLVLAQKAGRLGLNLPTDLIEEREKAEAKANEMERASGLSDRSAILLNTAERLAGAAEGGYQAIVDLILGRPEQDDDDAAPLGLAEAASGAEPYPHTITLDRGQPGGLALASRGDLRGEEPDEGDERNR